MTSWPLDLFCTTPAFAPILPYLMQFSDIPNHDDWAKIQLNALSQGGAAIRFVNPDLVQAYYEVEIYQNGNVATRLNWHDTFNAMVWQAFPHSKVALNALHHRAILSGNTQRGPQRDAATLLDECGLIVPYTDPAQLELLLNHQWHDLFVTEAANWGKTIDAFVFGHATYENLLSPFIGLTGKSWPVRVSADFFSQPLTAQIAQLDAHIAQELDQDKLQSPRQLPALPYLGIPDWWPQQDAAFYANDAYFRPKRVRQHPQ